MPRVSELLDGLLRALRRKGRTARGKARISLVQDIQNWATANAREGHVGKDTYDNYRANPNMQAQLGTALLFLEYLVAQRKPAGAVYRQCLEVLKNKRRQRFIRHTPQEDIRSANAITRHIGPYALIRMESHFRVPCVELIILSPAEGTERVRLATLVGRNLIMRGHWHLFGLSVYITGIGYRRGHLPDFMTISFLQTEQGTELSGGVLTGLTTNQREPVTASVIVKRMPHHPSVLKLGDFSDAEITAEFSKGIPQHVTDKQLEFLRDVEKEVFPAGMKRDSWFAQNVIDVTDNFVAGLRARDDFERIMLPELQRFCRRKW